MNHEEAWAVARIVSQADHGCPVCVGALCEKLSKAFPEYDWEALTAKAENERQSYLDAHDYDYEGLDPLLS